MEDLRTPPQANQAEAALVSALLQDPEALDRIDGLTAGHFYRRDTRAAFATIRDLAEASQPFDVVSLGEALEARGELEAVGGLPGLGALATASATPAHAAHYASLVTQAAASRRIIAAASRAIDAAHDQPPEPTAAALAAELEQISLGSAPGGFRAAKDLLRTVVEGIDRRWRGEPRVCVPTGLTDLDHALGGGLEPGQLCLLAARPAMGKSALGAQAAVHAARHCGPVAYFSLEMTAESVMERLLAGEARLRYDQIRKPSELDDGDWPRLSHTIARLTDLPLHISDRPGLTLTRLKAECRRLKREAGGLALIVVDYLGLMDAEGRADNQVQAIAALSRGLKLIAMEIEVPLLALAQLNRGPESRPNKRPVLADLRDSGSLEQDADLVLFLYRDEVYHEDSKDKGIAEIIVGKQRNGPVGTIRAAWLGRHVRFDSLADDGRQ